MVKQSSDLVLRVLLTRPEPQGRAFAQSLTDRFGAAIRPVLAPLMAQHLLAPELPAGAFAAVIFTSSTGVSAARPLRAKLPAHAYCVGRQTAEAAGAAGFHGTSADGDAEALIALILADPPKGRLLHLRGEEAQGNLAKRLSAAGVPTGELVIYRQEPRPLADDALALLRADIPLILPIFSSRSADLLRKALPAGMRAQLYLAALSEAVARRAATIPHARLISAARPDAEAMLDAIANLIAAAAPP